jgi:hypothetical protein
MSETTISEAPQPNAYLTTAYTELCRSHQALQDFRMKLLSLLPIASIAALLGLLWKSTSTVPAPDSLEAKVIGYIGVFSALFTAALFVYEARAILMCHDLSHVGATLEDRMNIRGQFNDCDERRNLPCYDTPFKRRLAPKINNKLASCAVYSLTFAAWFFVALHFVFEVNLDKCALWAGGTGLLLTLLCSAVLHALTDPPKNARPASSVGEAATA